MTWRFSSTAGIGGSAGGNGSAGVTCNNRVASPGATRTLTAGWLVRGPDVPFHSPELIGRERPGSFDTDSPPCVGDRRPCRWCPEVGGRDWIIIPEEGLPDKANWVVVRSHKYRNTCHL